MTRRRPINENPSGLEPFGRVAGRGKPRKAAPSEGLEGSTTSFRRVRVRAGMRDANYTITLPTFPTFRTLNNCYSKPMLCTDSLAGRVAIDGSGAGSIGARCRGGCQKFGKARSLHTTTPLIRGFFSRRANFEISSPRYASTTALCGGPGRNAIAVCPSRPLWALLADLAAHDRSRRLSTPSSQAGRILFSAIGGRA